MVLNGVSRYKLDVVYLFWWFLIVNCYDVILSLRDDFGFDFLEENMMIDLCVIGIYVYCDESKFEFFKVGKWYWKNEIFVYNIYV